MPLDTDTKSKSIASSVIDIDFQEPRKFFPKSKSAKFNIVLIFRQNNSVHGQNVLLLLRSTILSYNAISIIWKFIIRIKLV